MSVVSRLQGKPGTLKLPLPDTCIHKHKNWRSKRWWQKKKKTIQIRQGLPWNNFLWWETKQPRDPGCAMTASSQRWVDAEKAAHSFFLLQGVEEQAMAQRKGGRKPVPEQMLSFQRGETPQWKGGWVRRPSCAFLQGKRKEYLQGFLWGYSPGPEKGVRRGPGVEQMSQRHIFVRAPLSSPIFRRSRAGPVATFFFSRTSTGMKGAGTGLLSLSLCQIERESELDISLICLYALQQSWKVGLISLILQKELELRKVK